MELRERFKKETNKKLEVSRTFDCGYSETKVEIDVWNDDYIFWLENKIKKLNDENERLKFGGMEMAKELTNCQFEIVRLNFLMKNEQT